MASVGSGVMNAAAMLRDRFIRTAVVDPGSPLSGLRPDRVTVTDGRMFAAGETRSSFPARTSSLTHWA